MRCHSCSRFFFTNNSFLHMIFLKWKANASCGHSDLLSSAPDPGKNFRGFSAKPYRPTRQKTGYLVLLNFDVILNFMSCCRFEDKWSDFYGKMAEFVWLKFIQHPSVNSFQWPCAPMDPDPYLEHGFGSRCLNKHWKMFLNNFKRTLLNLKIYLLNELL